MTNPDLAALSDAATKGELDARGWGNGSTQMGMTNLFNDDAEVCIAECIVEADGKFIAALWNEYRAGRLVHIDEGMREATARTEAAEARNKVLEEALRACRRAISHGAEEPRRNVREIVDEALGGEHEHG